MNSSHLNVAVNSEAPSRLLAKHSEARLHLAKLINNRLAIEHRILHLEDRSKRLRETQAAEQRVLADLNALNASEAAAMVDWSRAPEGPEPQPDLSKRETLEAGLRTAAAKANAARQAETIIQADLGREHAALKALNVPTQHAIASVIAEEALGTPLEELRQAVQVGMQKQERVRQAVQAIFHIASFGGAIDEMRPAYKLAEKLDGDLRQAAAPPAPDGAPAFRSWLQLATDLHRDPLAEL